MSLRQAWTRASRTIEGPSSAKRSVLEEDASFLGCPAAGAVLLLDIAFEALKELLPYAGLCDEYVAAVCLVADPAQIAERAQGIQGACDHRLGNAERMGKTAHRVRPRRH